ncbi:MAG: hypothetical protein M3451_09500, partial [Chloroflexota bacterium]|nr:hypothetical protein [Chloroflexota bacterium]
SVTVIVVSRDVSGRVSLSASMSHRSRSSGRDNVPIRLGIVAGHDISHKGVCWARRHLDRNDLKALAIDLRRRDGDHWTLEKVGETLCVRMVGKDSCRRKTQVRHVPHLTNPSG